MRRWLILVAAPAAIAIAAGGAVSNAYGVQTNVIVGTDGNDVIHATPAADVISARRGDDVILDVGDGDVVYAGTGNDNVETLRDQAVRNVRIDGNVGDDLIGYVGSDNYVIGGSGRDTIIGFGDDNDVVGGSGDDAVLMFVNSSRVNLGDGSDWTHVEGRSNFVQLGNGKDVQEGSLSDSRLYAGSGDDSVGWSLGGGTFVDLGAGNDQARFETVFGLTVLGNSGRDFIGGSELSNFTFRGSSAEDTFEVGNGSHDGLVDGGSSRDVATVGHSDVERITCRSVERSFDFDGPTPTCARP